MDEEEAKHDAPPYLLVNHDLCESKGRSANCSRKCYWALLPGRPNATLVWRRTPQICVCLRLEESSINGRILGVRDHGSAVGDCSDRVSLRHQSCWRDSGLHPDLKTLWRKAAGILFQCCKERAEQPKRRTPSAALQLPDSSVPYPTISQRTMMLLTKSILVQRVFPESRSRCQDMQGDPGRCKVRASPLRLDYAFAVLA